MIKASKRAACVALVTALTVHLVGVTWALPEQRAEIAGGTVGAAEASLGDAFADMATGTLTAVEVIEVTENAPLVEVTEPALIQDILEQSQPEKLQSHMPVVAEAPTGTINSTPQQPVETIARIEALAETPPTNPLAVERAPDPTIQAAETPAEQVLEAIPSPVLQSLSAVAPSPPVQPVEQNKLDVLTAAETATNEVTQSLRPKVRSRAFEERNKPKDPPPIQRRTARQIPQAQAPRGNQAKVNARAGSTDGSTTAAPAQRATGNAARQAGNARATNYPGQVMRKIQRVRKPRLGVRGTTTVAFRISGGGGLAGLSVARSSGSAQLDQAALGVIRRAAPFPAPPQGARRSFSIQVKMK